MYIIFPLLQRRPSIFSPPAFYYRRQIRTCSTPQKNKEHTPSDEPTPDRPRPRPRLLTPYDVPLLNPQASSSYFV